MSMNLYIEGVRNIIVEKTNEKTTQQIFIELWQTPTSIAYELRAKGTFEKILEAYCDWIMTFKEQYQPIPIYDPKDFFCEGDPIRYEENLICEDHIEELKKEIELYKKGGFVLTFVVL